MPTRSIIFAGIALVLSAVAMCALIKVFPEQLYEAPIYGLLAALILPPLVVTLVAFRKRSGAQKIRIFGAMLAFSFLLGCVGNVVSRKSTFMGSQDILLNWIQAVVMLLGGMVSGSVLFRGAQVAALAGGQTMPGDSSAASGATRKRPGQAAQAAPESDKAAASATATSAELLDEPSAKSPVQTNNKLASLGKDKSKRDMSNSATNLRGMLDSFAADDDDDKPIPAKAAEIAAKADAIAKKALANALAEDEVTSSTKLNVVPEARKTSVSQSGMPAQPRTPGASQSGIPAVRPGSSQTGLPEQKKPTASATGLPEMRKPTATSTATRLQAQKRKSTSTFIKLQALSSSGTGASRPKTEGGAEGESLKSILDRLGPDEEEADDSDFFGTDSLLSKPGSSQDKLPAVSPPEAHSAKTSGTSLPAQSPKTSGTTMPAQSPRTSATKMPAQTGQGALTSPASTAAASDSAKPASTSSSASTPSSAVTSPAAKPVPSASAVKSDSKSSTAFSPKGSDTTMPAVSPQKSLTKLPAETSALKTGESQAASEPQVKSIPEPRLGEPSMTDLLNSIKTPELSRTESSAEKKAERPVGGLGGTSLGRVAGKKSGGIALGGTSSSNISPLKPDGMTPKSEEAGPAEPIAAPPTAPSPSTTVEPEVQAAIAASPPEAAPDTVPVSPPETSVPTPEAAISFPSTEVVQEPSTPPLEVAAAETPQMSFNAAPEAVVQPALAEPQKPTAAASAPPPITSAAALVESLASLAGAESPPEQSTDFSHIGESFKPTFDTSAFEEKPVEAKQTESLDFSTEPGQTEPSGNLFEAGVDQEIEEIFSNLVPAEAQKEVDATRTSYTRLDAIENPTEALTSSESLMPLESMRTSMGMSEVEPIQKQSSSQPSPVSEPLPAASEASHASADLPQAPPEMAPAEIVEQQEVVESNQPLPKAAPVAAEQLGSLFETGVDQEIEEIFSNLVPPEAQKEVTEEVRASYTNLRAMTPATESLTREFEVLEPAARHDAEPAQGARSAVEVAPESVPSSVSQALTEVAPPEPVQEPVAAEAVTSAPEAAPEAASGLFDPSLDKEIDQIFQSLAPESALEEVTKETLAKIKGIDVTDEISFAPPAPAPTEEPAQHASISGTIEETLPHQASQPAEAPAAVQMETTEPPVVTPETQAAPELPAVSPPQEVTGELPAAKPAPASIAPEPPVMNVPPASAASATAASAIAQSKPPATPTPIVAPAKEVKEFGRLSAKSAKPGQTSETVGTMKTIGKLLIDVQAVENIIKTGESGTIGKNLATARVVSLERGEGINALLAKIDLYKGVSGSLIVGHDGLVIASTVKNGRDKDSLGALSVACLGSTNLGTRKLEIGKLKQMVLITDSTITVLTDVQVGILAVFMDMVDVTKVDGLLETIHQTIHG